MLERVKVVSHNKSIRKGRRINKGVKKREEGKKKKNKKKMNMKEDNEPKF